MSSAQECVPPCRCQFVQRWLDMHAKYFPDPSSPKPALYPKPNLATYVTPRTYGPTQVHCYYNGPVQHASKVVQMPCVVQPPHRISPTYPNKH